MPKRKNNKKAFNADFTINDCANASKPVGRVKKSVTPKPITSFEKTWEDDDLEVVQRLNLAAITVFPKKKKNRTKTYSSVDDDSGIVYPEIVWYLISPYIKPEEVGHFAGINRSTYSITKRESFWRAMYKRYCQYKPYLLPEKFRIDNDFKLYGLRQKVVRALYHTYDVFIDRVFLNEVQGNRVPQVVKRHCVDVWTRKSTNNWVVYFKLRKSRRVRRCESFIEELGRIDANPEVDTIVLQVTCLSSCEIPDCLGLTVSSLQLSVSEMCKHRFLRLGFNRTHDRVLLRNYPEVVIYIYFIVDIMIYDWWDPKYPYYEIKLPTYMREEESVPVLKKDFFSS